MNYEINEKTLAIIPSEESKCKAIEFNKSYDLSKSSYRVIEHNCEYFGVSYKSRVESSSKLLKTKYKTPIIIEEISRLVFFPINSPIKNDALWINYNNILDYYSLKTKKKMTIVRFKNGMKMELPVSYYSFNNQFLKASRLNDVLSARLLNKKRRKR